MNCSCDSVDTIWLRISSCSIRLRRLLVKWVFSFKREMIFWIVLPMHRNFNTNRQLILKVGFVRGYQPWPWSWATNNKNPPCKHTTGKIVRRIEKSLLFFPFKCFRFLFVRKGAESIKKIEQLYAELNLPERFDRYEEDTYQAIKQQIHQLLSSSEHLQHIMIETLNRTFNRTWSTKETKTDNSNRFDVWNKCENIKSMIRPERTMETMRGARGAKRHQKTKKSSSNTKEKTKNEIFSFWAHFFLSFGACLPLGDASVFTFWSL